MRLDCPILLKSLPTNLRAGSALGTDCRDTYYNHKGCFIKETVSHLVNFEKDRASLRELVGQVKGLVI